MKFDYDDEQRLLAESVQRLLAHDYGFDERRRIVASGRGASEAVWSAFADLGILGLGLHPDHGGFGGGATTTQCVMEAIGESLVVEPYLSTVGLCARLIERGATDARKRDLLRDVMAGNAILALATTEVDSGYDLHRVATRARREDGGYVLEGDKRVVLHAPLAHRLLVSARTAGDVADPVGIDLFVVDPAAPGVTVKPYRTLDGAPAADVLLASVRVSLDDRIGAAGAGEGNAWPLLDEAVDYATALLCAEAVGALRYANAATLEYLKERRQFGVPIGSFQALQHRMVDMTLSFEQARSMAALCCATVDGEHDANARRRVVSAAKIRIADAARHVSQEAVQLHGGMGMTEELKISHTFRRLTMIAQQFGDADHHLQRFTAVERAAGATS